MAAVVKNCPPSADATDETGEAAKTVGVKVVVASEAMVVVTEVKVVGLEVTVGR